MIWKMSPPSTPSENPIGGVRALTRNSRRAMGDESPKLVEAPKLAEAAVDGVAQRGLPRVVERVVVQLVHHVGEA